MSKIKFIAVDEQVQYYCDSHINGESALLKELRAHTHKVQLAPYMMSGPMIGQLLNMLVHISGATRVLEVGMFTGYTALSMAEALPINGEVITCEHETEFINFAQQYFSRSAHGDKIKVLSGNALDTLATLINKADKFDLAFIDAQKTEYPEYFALIWPLLRVGGLMLFDNTLLEGRVLNPQKHKDKVMQAFNKQQSQDPRVQQIILPIQDGFSIVRKIRD